MRRFWLLSALCALPAVAVDAAEQIKTMTRGVNIIGYDPLWRDFSKARIQERHFQRIHDAGFQSVRIVLQAMSHMKAENRLDPTWFRPLDWAVAQATANGLTAILDLHDYNVCGQDADGCKPNLMAFWEQAAEHFKDAPNTAVRDPERAEQRSHAGSLECVGQGGAGNRPQDQPGAQRDCRSGVLEQR